MRKLLAVVSALLATSGGCAVTTKDASSCADVRPHAAVADCLQRELDAVNRQLHLCYEGVRTRIGQELAGIEQARQPGTYSALVDARNELEMAESAWMTYRDGFCAGVEGMWTTGSGAGNAGLSCQIELTDEQYEPPRRRFQPGRKACNGSLSVWATNMLSVRELRAISIARLRDAEVLLKARRFDGAVYLCGDAVEIALKARICRTLDWVEFPQTNK